MIYDPVVRERMMYLRSIAPKDPSKWTTHKFSFTDSTLLGRALAGRKFDTNFVTTKNVCIVCGGEFYSYGRTETRKSTCFECTQWTTGERKRNKEQMNLFNQEQQ